jgi:hypothetical protein
LDKLLKELQLITELGLLLEQAQAQPRQQVQRPRQQVQRPRQQVQQPRQPLERQQVQQPRQPLERQQLAVPSTSSSQSMRKPIQLQPMQKNCGTCVFSYERTS